MILLTLGDVSTGEKSNPAECEETVLQQFSAIWGIVIMEVLSQASNRSQNGFMVSVKMLWKK